MNNVPREGVFFVKGKKKGSGTPKTNLVPSRAEDPSSQFMKSVVNSPTVLRDSKFARHLNRGPPKLNLEELSNSIKKIVPP